MFAYVKIGKSLVYDCTFYMTYVNIVSMRLVFGTRL